MFNMVKIGGLSGMVLVVALAAMYSTGAQYGVAASNNQSMSLSEMESASLNAFNTAEDNISSDLNTSERVYWATVGESLLDWGKLSFIVGLEVGYLVPPLGVFTAIAVPVSALGTTGLYLRKLWRES